MNYSLLCLHTVFNGPEMEAVMGSNTSYVTMLRDPVEVFESEYSFYNLSKFYGMSLGSMQIIFKVAINSLTQRILHGHQKLESY